MRDISTFATSLEPTVNSNRQNSRRSHLGDVAFALVVSRLTGVFSGLWRFQRLIWRLIGLGLALMVASFILPGLVCTLLSTAALWPVYVGGAFALWACRRGDRVSLKTYGARVRAAAAANRELVRKAATVAGAAGAGVAANALTTGGAGLWRAGDLAVGVGVGLFVAAVGALELVARERTVPGARPARASMARVRPQRQRAVLDAPGPRSSTNRKAGIR